VTRWRKLLHEKHVCGSRRLGAAVYETIVRLRFSFFVARSDRARALDLRVGSRSGKVAEAALSIGEVLGKNTLAFALITNTLAKEKESRIAASIPRARSPRATWRTSSR